MALPRLGEIFVANGIITQKTVDRVLARAKAMDKRFGTLLEDMELITGEELAAALAIQYGCKVVNNLPNIVVQPELLNLIPVGVAMQNLIFPIKKEKNMLAIAMADPTETRVVGNIAADHGLKIVPFVATKRDIHVAICKYYLNKAPTVPKERTVLVVEDDNLIQTMLCNMLVKSGYRVVTANDGIEAYKIVIAEKPHVIITDKEMPKLDGYGLLEALKNVPETSFIPVILVTAKTMNAEEESKAFERGFFDFIPKPVPEVTLKARVKRAFQFYDHQYRLF